MYINIYKARQYCRLDASLYPFRLRICEGTYISKHPSNQSKTYIWHIRSNINDFLKTSYLEASI